MSLSWRHTSVVAERLQGIRAKGGNMLIRLLTTALSTVMLTLVMAQPSLALLQNSSAPAGGADIKTSAGSTQANEVRAPLSAAGGQIQPAPVGTRSGPPASTGSDANQSGST